MSQYQYSKGNPQHILFLHSQISHGGRNISAESSQDVNNDGNFK